MRADRLISIVLLLQNRGRMTSRELSEKLEVSERTIHRDMEALSSAGIPIMADRGVNGGWALSEGYKTTLTGMKSEEMLSLLLAHPSGVLGDLGMHSVFEAAYQKLIAAFPAAFRKEAEVVRQRIHIDGAGWNQSTEQVPFLPIIQEAVWEERRLIIHYLREQELVERIVNPLGLVAKSSIWYLVASAPDGLRTYRISRLQYVRKQEEFFERLDSFDLAAYWEQSTSLFKSQLPVYPARVRIKEQQLSRLSAQWYVKLLHANQAINGFVEADMEFQTLESASELILRFGSAIEVLEPVELRDKVWSEAQAILSLYE